MLYNDNLFKFGSSILFAGLAVIILGDNNWIVFLTLIAITFSVLMFSDDNVPNIEMKRIIKGKNYKEGDEIKVRFILTNTSQSTFRGEIVDTLPEYASVVEGSNIFHTKIDPKQSIELSYKLMIQRRGKYIIGPVKLRHHVLGLHKESQWEIESLKEIIIIPSPEKVTTYTLPPSLLTSFGGVFRSKMVGDGIDFAGVREYQPGDPLRRINWKQTAKHDQLYANEFELNRSTNILMVLDLTEESVEVADASVRAALGLANYLINSRTKVGVMTLGKYINLIPSRGGKRHLIEISQHLTTVDHIKQIKDLQLYRLRLEEAVERANNQDYEIILFSSLNRPENVKILSETLTKLGKMIVLAPSGVRLPTKNDLFMGFATRLLALRKKVMRQNLARKDIRVFEWIPELPFETSIQTWRYK